MPFCASSRCEGGRTALMIAAAAGHKESVELLAPLEIGLTDDDWHTALMYACENGHPDCALLLKDEEQRFWATALMLIVRYGNPSFIPRINDFMDQASK